MNISIRKVRRKDWPELQQLFLQTRQQAYKWLDSDSFQLMDLDDQTSGETILVAEDERGKVMGTTQEWVYLSASRKSSLGRLASTRYLATRG